MLTLLDFVPVVRLSVLLSSSLSVVLRPMFELLKLLLERGKVRISCAVAQTTNHCVSIRLRCRNLHVCSLEDSPQALSRVELQHSLTAFSRRARTNETFALTLSSMYHQQFDLLHLQRMHASTGVKPSLVCFNGALHGMSCAGEGKRARQLLEAMQRGPRATRCVVSNGTYSCTVCTPLAMQLVLTTCILCSLESSRCVVNRACAVEPPRSAVSLALNTDASGEARVPFHPSG